MSTIGKFLLIFGLVAMAALFALSLVLYLKDKRMELAVMGFALAAAVAISGVTATMRNRADARRALVAEAAATQSAQSAEVLAAATNETWFSQPDGTYLHADGTPAEESRLGVPTIPSGPVPAEPEPPLSAPAPADAFGGTQDVPEAPTPA